MQHMGNLYAATGVGFMPAHDDAPERLPIKDAAAQMGVSIDTVRRHLRTGKLHGELEGGKWKVEVPADRAVSLERSGVPAPHVIAILTQELEWRHEEVLRMQGLLDRLLSERK